MFVHVVDLVVDPTVHWYIVLLVGQSHVTSFCSLWRPISVLVVVVWLFIDTQKRLVALHSALVGSRRDGHTTRTV